MNDEVLFDAPRHCAEVYNSYIGAVAISAAWQIGLLDSVEAEKEVHVATFSDDRGLHRDTVAALVGALVHVYVLDTDDRVLARPGVAFEEIQRTKGFFQWAVAGCGDLLRTLPSIMPEDARRGEYYVRDDRAISVACRHIARTWFEPPFHRMLQDIRFDVVADLGCGSGDRIVTLAKAFPHSRAIGIDVAPGALEVASEAVAENALGDRVTLVEDDVLNLTERPEYREAELLTCFLMGHDFWPLENCVATLSRLAEVFPRAQHLVLGDTCRSTGLDTQVPAPIFSLGFELVHAAMDQGLPTIADWDDAIRASGWFVADTTEVTTPHASFISRLERVGGRA